MKRTTREILQDLNRKRTQRVGNADDKYSRQPLAGFMPKRRALSPSVPHSKTYGH